jgi:hypothetical protein
MSGNLEARVFRLEQQLVTAQQQIASLQSTAALLAQQVQYAGNSGGGSSGGTNGFYVAYPTAVVSGASWTFSGTTVTAITGVTFTAQVIQVSYNGTSQTVTSLGSQNCVNWIPAPLKADYGIIVYPDGAGSYGVGAQSCV